VEEPSGRMRMSRRRSRGKKVGNGGGICRLAEHGKGRTALSFGCSASYTANAEGCTVSPLRWGW